MALTHGKSSTYNSGCRCEPCCTANTQRAARYRARSKTRVAEDPTIVVHGRLGTYINRGCRCPQCTRANSEYCKQRRVTSPPKTNRRTHGRMSTYLAGCRCTPCNNAHNVAQAQRVQRRKIRLQADPTLARHGSVSTYTNWGCRCTLCTAARTKYHRELRRKKLYRSYQKADAT